MNNLYLCLKKDDVSINFTIIRYVMNNEVSAEKSCDYITKTNDLECYYNYDAENGDWGSVGEVAFKAEELSAVTKRLKRILEKETACIHFETEKPLFILDAGISKEKYSFCFKVADGLMPDEWVEIKLEELNVEEFEKYAMVFLRWAEMFPVLTEEQLRETEVVPW